MFRTRLSLAALPVLLAFAGCSSPPPPPTQVIVQSPAPPPVVATSSRQARRRRPNRSWCPRRRRVLVPRSGNPAIGSSRP